MRSPTGATEMPGLAGGTWLFSEPQPGLHRLIDLEGLRWEPLQVNETGLAIAATCTISQLYGLTAPEEWKAAPLIRQCCRSLLASFKIWNTATVGGNICMSLPAGALISLTAALEGVCTIWQRDGGERRVPVLDFVTGDQSECPRSGRSASQHRLAGICPSQANELSPNVADAPRPVLGAADRRLMPARREFRADRHRRDSATRSDRVSPGSLLPINFEASFAKRSRMLCTWRTFTGPLLTANI